MGGDFDGHPVDPVARTGTYLRNDTGKDWGSLYAVHPYETDALPASTAAHAHLEEHWGLWSPGPTPNPITLPGDAPTPTTAPTSNPDHADR